MTRPVLGANQGIGPAAPLGDMRHVEPTTFNLLVQVGTQLRAHREATDAVNRMFAEGLKRRA